MNVQTSNFHHYEAKPSQGELVQDPFGIYHGYISYVFGPLTFLKLVDQVGGWEGCVTRANPET